jgi:hypothetical protein
MRRVIGAHLAERRCFAALQRSFNTQSTAVFEVGRPRTASLENPIAPVHRVAPVVAAVKGPFTVVSRPPPVRHERQLCRRLLRAEKYRCMAVQAMLHGLSRLGGLEAPRTVLGQWNASRFLQRVRWAGTADCVTFDS